MNIRNEIAKLRQQTDSLQFRGDVEVISSLMDELSAIATGEEAFAKSVTLQQLFSPYQPDYRNNP